MLRIQTELLAPTVWIPLGCVWNCWTWVLLSLSAPHDHFKKEHQTFWTKPPCNRKAHHLVKGACSESQWLKGVRNKTGQLEMTTIILSRTFIHFLIRLALQATWELFQNETLLFKLHDFRIYPNRNPQVLCLPLIKVCVSQLINVLHKNSIMKLYL